MASRSGRAFTWSASRPRASTGRISSFARKSRSATNRFPKSLRAMSRSSRPQSIIAEKVMDASVVAGSSEEHPRRPGRRIAIRAAGVTR